MRLPSVFLGRPWLAWKTEDPNLVTRVPTNCQNGMTRKNWSGFPVGFPKKGTLESHTPIYMRLF